jgi:hypothetical protein
MSRLRVEVHGPAGRRWLLLPATAPVADLLPVLVELVGGVEPDLPALAPPVGRPLDPGASLQACGVRPGSTLCLVGVQLAEDARGVLPPHALVGMRTPSARTADMLPGSLTAWMRLRTALHLAAVAPPPALPALPARGAPSLHPMAFTQVRPPSLWRRGRQAWDQLDRQRRLEALVTRARLRRGVTVAVVAPAPGLGSTVVTGLLGTLLAHLRRDRVIAVDAAPGPGSLRALVAPAGPAGWAGAPDQADGRGLMLTGLDASLGQGYHGLRVLALPPGRDLIERLTRFAGVLLVDCGSGLDAPATAAVLGLADQALVVADASREARAALGETVERVRRGGRSALLVANAPRRPAGPHDAGRIAVCAPDAEGLVEVPWSPAGVAQLAEGRFEWEHAPGAWIRAGHELAAALVADWERLRLTTQ